MNPIPGRLAAGLLAALAAYLCCAADTAPTPSTAPASAPASAPTIPAPLRGLHTLMPGYWGGEGRGHIADCAKFIRTILAPRGVNVLVLEVGYDYQYTSVPRIGLPKGVTKEDVKLLLAACRESHIRLVPQLNCLGHQSKDPGTLLGEYPAYIEKPGSYPKNLKNPMPEQSQGTSYCPLHPEVHKAIFALLDELGEVFEAECVHVGMDEVFAIASSNCPRCAEKDPADLFAGEVTALHDHLASKGRTMWMWGDRFILAAQFGYEDWGWGSSRNYTHPAVDKVPKDIVVCDWQYAHAPKTPQFFAGRGFRVIACPWDHEDVALQQLAAMRQLAADSKTADRSLGVMETTWVEMQDFITAWEGKALDPGPKAPQWKQDGYHAATASVATFRKLSDTWK